MSARQFRTHTLTDGHRLARADSTEAAVTTADTFLRFKGLDRPLALVTELELAAVSAKARPTTCACTSP
jgi:hypothetical protein